MNGPNNYSRSHLNLKALLDEAIPLALIILDLKIYEKEEENLPEWSMTDVTSGCSNPDGPSAKVGTGAAKDDYVPANSQ